MAGNREIVFVSELLRLADQAVARYERSPGDSGLGEAFRRIDDLVRELEVRFIAEMDRARFALAQAEGLPIEGHGMRHRIFSNSALDGTTRIVERYGAVLERLTRYFSVRVQWHKAAGVPGEHPYLPGDMRLMAAPNNVEG